MPRIALLVWLAAATIVASAAASPQSNGTATAVAQSRPDAADGPRLVPLWIARPDYPRIAHAARVQGVVVVDIEVGADGRVSSSKVTRSIPLLDQAALDALKETYFLCEACGSTPLRRTMTYVFELRDEAGEPPALDVTPERIVVGVPALVPPMMPQMARR